MRTLAHISDIHFGREDPVVAEALAADLNVLSPDLVINSGDFTQRGRSAQFANAARFMARLPGPQLSVPGNHDIPLYDFVRRAFMPLRRYKRYITADLFPRYVDPELAVVGLNTARSLTWKNGRVSLAQIEKLNTFLQNLPDDVFKIVVTHHPFLPPPGMAEGAISLVGRAHNVLEVIEANEVDLLLSGHLHHGYTGDIRTAYPGTKRAIVAVQAGTAVSRRLRHERNAYNHIRVDRKQIEIRIRLWSDGKFSDSLRTVYRRQAGNWQIE